MWLRDTGHIGIHGWVDGRTYVRTDVHDVMAIKPNFLTSMGYHIFLSAWKTARFPSVFQKDDEMDLCLFPSGLYNLCSKNYCGTNEQTFCNFA